MALEVCKAISNYMSNQIILFLMARSNFGSCYCHDFETSIDLLNSCVKYFDEVQFENKNTVSRYFYENVGFQISCSLRPGISK